MKQQQRSLLSSCKLECCKRITESAAVASSQYLEEESQDLAPEMLPPGLLVVHDPARGGEHHVAELSGGQQVVGPLLDLVDGDLELPDVSVLHHDGEEPDHHLGARPDQDLPLAALLSVVDALEAVRQ